MAIEFGMATLADLKARLGWNSTDEDSLLSDYLKASSGAIEAYAGRTLRRVHTRTEVFNGGSDTIQLGVYPIAKIHSVRESETRDFTDSDNYTELTEGTDFVLDSLGEAKRPGETGIVRRLDAPWLGSKTSPGQVQVIYSGGWKTEDEVAAESTSLTISASDYIEGYGIQRTVSTDFYEFTRVGSDTIYIDQEAGAFANIRGVFVIKVEDLLLGSWRLTTADLKLASLDYDGSPDCNVVIIDPNDVAIASATPEEIYDAIADGVVADSLGYNAPTRETISLRGDADMVAALERSVTAGVIAIGFISTLTDDSVSAVYTVEHATEAVRPTLEITHRPSFTDPFAIETDLKHACLLQATYEYQSRSNLGLLTQAQRGVSIASGASIKKEQIDLLPEVRRIASHYKRIF